MAFPLSVPDKLGRSDIGDHGQAIIQDPGCVVITRSGRAEKAQQIRLVVWHQTKSENRPAAGKIDLRKMKVKHQLCLMISNPPHFKSILRSH